MTNKKLQSLLDIPKVEKNAEGKLRGGFIAICKNPIVTYGGPNGLCSDNEGCSDNVECYNNNDPHACSGNIDATACSNHKMNTDTSTSTGTSRGENMLGSISDILNLL